MLRKPAHSNGRVCSWFLLTAIVVVSMVSVLYIMSFVDTTSTDIKRFNWVLQGSGNDKHTKNIGSDPHPSKVPVGTIKEGKNTSFTSRTTQELMHNAPLLKLPSPLAANSFEELHFIHIPKCGGTTMTAVLRQIQCYISPVKNADCCLNPGFCDWHAHRRCASIKGCINHFPNRRNIYKAIPSIAVFRDPLSRIISAWFYRGHSPNLDFFQVRPEFKEIKEGKRPRVTFSEYIEMPEYQNIQTRMLGADSFPYRNITITEEIFNKAVDAVKHLSFIGLQEEFSVSSVMLVREMELNLTPNIKKERDQSSMKLSKQKDELKANTSLMERAKAVNSYDYRLYAVAARRFCETLNKYEDLSAQVAANAKVLCTLD